MQDRLSIYSLLLCSSLLVSCTSGPAAGNDGQQHAVPFVAVDFDQEPSGGLYEQLLNHSMISLAEGQGIGGSHAIRVTYEGYDRGSRRVGTRFNLPQAGEELTLSYDVRFDGDFQFVRGGKLHGLGPVRPVTGGNPMRPEGWSARVSFSGNEGIRTYLYVQDKPGQYGVGMGNDAFRFERDRFYAVSLHVRLNDPPQASNGFARVYVDGDLVIDHSNVRFRDSNDPETLISQFLFSTFHGGSAPHWAPRTATDDYATVYAYFDNIAVYPGKVIRNEPGLCWER